MNEDPAGKMSVIQHLEEVRRRIIACLVIFLASSIVSFIFIDKIVYILRLPSEGIIKDLVFLAPTEAFVSYVRVAVLSGFIISIPFILIQLGLFFMPAISPERQRSVFTWLGSSFLLSIAGIIFSYFLAIPFALKFLINFAEGMAVPMISMGRYFSFISAFLLIGAGIFQIPVIMGLLASMGILKTDFLCKKRKYAIVVILIIAAIITPTQDVFNMFVFALPMWGLYEIGILVTRIIEKKRG